MLIIKFPGYLAPGLNGKDGLLRMHWSRRRALARDLSIWIRCISASLSGCSTPLTGPVLVRYTRRYAKQPMDWDNLGASFKLIGDALVRAGVLADDSPKVIGRLELAQVKVASIKKQGTTIEIEEQTE